MESDDGEESSWIERVEELSDYEGELGTSEADNSVDSGASLSLICGERNISASSSAVSVLPEEGTINRVNATTSCDDEEAKCTDDWILESIGMSTMLSYCSGVHNETMKCVEALEKGTQVSTNEAAAFAAERAMLVRNMHRLLVTANNEVRQLKDKVLNLTQQ